MSASGRLKTLFRWRALRSCAKNLKTINLLRDQPLAVFNPFADAFDRVKTCSEEMQELMVSLLIELIPEQIDGMADCMANPLRRSFIRQCLSGVCVVGYITVDE